MLYRDECTGIVAAGAYETVSDSSYPLPAGWGCF